MLYFEAKIIKHEHPLMDIELFHLGNRQNFD